MLTLVVLDRLLRPAEQLDNSRMIVDLLQSSVAPKHLGLCAKLAVRRAHTCPPLSYFNDQRLEEDGKSLDQQLFEAGYTKGTGQRTLGNKSPKYRSQGVSGLEGSTSREGGLSEIFEEDCQSNLESSAKEQRQPSMMTLKPL